MKFIAGLRVWGNWEIGENVLKVFLRLRGSANRRVDLFLPLIASISGRRQGARSGRTVASGQWPVNAKRGTSRLTPHASRPTPHVSRLPETVAPAASGNLRLGHAWRRASIRFKALPILLSSLGAFCLFDLRVF